MVRPSALKAIGGIISQACGLGWANGWGFAPKVIARGSRSSLGQTQCRIVGFQRAAGPVVCPGQAEGLVTEPPRHAKGCLVLVRCAERRCPGTTDDSDRVEPLRPMDPGRF